VLAASRLVHPTTYSAATGGRAMVMTYGMGKVLGQAEAQGSRRCFWGMKQPIPAACLAEQTAGSH